MQHELTLPIDHKTARTLRVGDVLFLTGDLFTARDQAHVLMLSLHASGSDLPFDPSQMALFHCGPVISKHADGWKVVAAGPTTSIRMEPFEDQFWGYFVLPSSSEREEWAMAQVPRCNPLARSMPNTQAEPEPWLPNESMLLTVCTGSKNWA